MASLDTLRDFIKGRLAAYDPSIDISDGSPATTEVVDPIIARLGTQPFDLDTKTFIEQRIAETYPNIFTIGEIEDLFVNPLLTIIEPLIQEEQRIAIGQSLNNIDLLADEEVDDLIANSFEQRENGGFASGFIRCYYPSPRNLVITTDKAAISKSGLKFYSPENIETTSAQMLLNREGFNYFLDIFFVAEKPGEDYNIEPDNIASIEDLRNPVKVINLFKFTGGITAETNEQLVQKAADGRIEQSLNAKRGAAARTKKLFPSIKAIQTIGAGELGMNRDIIDGTSDGLCYLTFIGSIFGNWALLDTDRRFIDSSQLIEPGDLIKFQIATGGIVYSAKVSTILLKTVGPPIKYLLELDSDFGTPLLFGQSIAGVLYKQGYITISKVPEGMLSGTIPSNTVHIGGHMDVYVAPTDDVTLEAIVKNVSDQSPFFETLTGVTLASDNQFSTSPSTNFISTDISVGDSLVIESGPNIGSYEIIYVETNLIRVSSILSAGTGLKARILKKVTVDYLEPKLLKLPFITPVTDLSVTAGSTQFITAASLYLYNATIGDVIEILTGPNIGRYTIIEFDTILGGRGPIVDKPAVFTATGISYKLFSIQAGLQTPIVRTTKIDLLDTSNQVTGFTIPYGDLVDVRAKCNFEVERKPEVVLEKKLFFVPDLFPLVPILNFYATAGIGVDARYSQDIESHDGPVRVVTASGLNPIDTIEINIPPFTYDTRKNTVMALVSKKDPTFTSDPSTNPQTSPLAKAKIEDILSVLNGPNSANYMIRDLRVLNLWGVSNAGHYEIAIAKVDGELKTDPTNNIISFIEKGTLEGSGVAAFTLTDYMKIFQYATDWNHASGFIESVLIPRFKDTLTYYGFTLTTQECRDFINGTTLSAYAVGQAPRGELRCYAKEPVTVNLYPEPITISGSSEYSATTFDELLSINSTVPRKKVRIAPNLGQGQIYPQSAEELDISQYTRNASLRYPADRYLYLTDSPSFLLRGVKEGDALEYYPAINDYPSRGLQNSSYLAVTTSGSDIVSLVLPSTRNNQTNLSIDQIICIDSGPDVGIYKVVEVIADSHPIYKVRLNKALTHTTLPYPTLVFTGTVQTGTQKLVDVNIPAIVSIDQYVSIYAATNTTILTNGEDTDYLGTYKVLSIGLDFVTLDRTTNFPANANVLWVAHEAPSIIPVPTSNGGTELTIQFVRARHYSKTKESQIISIDWAAVPNPLDPSSTKQIQLPNSVTTNGSIVNFSHKMPFRIVRDGIKIISSTELSEQREQGLYYFDIPVLSLGTTPEYLFKENSPFCITGSYEIEGYKMRPDNKILSYSTRETGTFQFPLSILPAGASYSRDNYVPIVGANIKISYDQAPTIRNIQQFFSSPLDRIANTNALVRHFLPAYPYIELSYIGGADTDITAKDVISYINTLIAEDNQIRVDALTDLLKKRLAKQITNPIQLVALVHGEDRSIRTLRSEDSIGILNDPIYDGQQRMIIFYAGQDVSKETTIPNQEYVKLTRG